MPGRQAKDPLLLLGVPIERLLCLRVYVHCLACIPCISCGAGLARMLCPRTVRMQRRMGIASIRCMARMEFFPVRDAWLLRFCRWLVCIVLHCSSVWCLLVNLQCTHDSASRTLPAAP